VRDSILLETVLEMLGVSPDARKSLQLEFRDKQERERVENEARCYRIAYPYGRLVSVNEVLSRRKHKPSVAARIHCLNPGGVREGDKIRGVYYHRRWRFDLDVVPLRKYEQRWGTRDGARVVYKSGRWKFVSGASYMQGPNA